MENPIIIWIFNRINGGTIFELFISWGNLPNIELFVTYAIFSLMTVEKTLRTPVEISEISIKPAEKGSFHGSALVKEPNQKLGIVNSIGETRKEAIKELLTSIKVLQDMP